jgi:hypothetical protein
MGKSRFSAHCIIISIITNKILIIILCYTGTHIRSPRYDHRRKSGLDMHTHSTAAQTPREEGSRLLKTDNTYKYGLAAAGGRTKDNRAA